MIQIVVNCEICEKPLHECDCPSCKICGKKGRALCYAEHNMFISQRIIHKLVPYADKLDYEKSVEIVSAKLAEKFKDVKTSAFIWGAQNNVFYAEEIRGFWVHNPNGNSKNNFFCFSYYLGMYNYYVYTEFHHKLCSYSKEGLIASTLNLYLNNRLNQINNRLIAQETALSQEKDDLLYSFCAERPSDDSK